MAIWVDWLSTAKRLFWNSFVCTLLVHDIMSCARDIMSCARHIISCARDNKSCARDIMSCARDIMSCARDIMSCARDNKSCARDNMSCARHNFFQKKILCVLNIPPYSRPLETILLIDDVTAKFREKEGHLFH